MSGYSRKGAIGRFAYKGFGSGVLPLQTQVAVTPAPMMLSEHPAPPAALVPMMGAEDSAPAVDLAPMCGAQFPSCTRTFNQEVCLQTDLVVRPTITCFPTAVRCLEGGIGVCTGTPVLECRETVFQRLCAEFVVIFSATPFCENPVIVCEELAEGPCPVV